jgi:hypothetical protein
MIQRNTARILYKKLLILYPKAFRERLAESMEQTFNDLYKERYIQGDGFSFVLSTFIETASGIMREHVLIISQGDAMKTISSSPGLAALIGFLCSMPFIVMNALVGNQVEPFLSFIRPNGHTSTFEYGLLAFVLLLLPLGAFITLRPMLQKQRDEKRKLYVFNIILALVLFAGFSMISMSLGSDIYRCDVLQIPNCD